MSKTAAAMLAFVGLLLFSIPMSAQFNGLLANGNAYVGVSYGQLTNIVNKQSYKGWDASLELLPFARLQHLGVFVDGSGFYRQGVTQYQAVGGARLFSNVGRWRPFFQVGAGIRRLNSSGFIWSPMVIDVGGGADYKLGIKNFSWRVQGDYMRTSYASNTQNDYRGSTGIVWRF